MKTTFLSLVVSCFSLFLGVPGAFCQTDSLTVDPVAADSVIIQLDSIFVTGAVISVTDPADSSYTYNLAQVTLHFDHIEDLGNLAVVAYDTLSGAPIGEFIRTRQQLIDEGLLVADHITWSLFPMVPGFTYRIEVTPQNLNGAYSRIGFIILSN